MFIFKFRLIHYFSSIYYRVLFSIFFKLLKGYLPATSYDNLKERKKKRINFQVRRTRNSVSGAAGQYSTGPIRRLGRIEFCRL